MPFRFSTLALLALFAGGAGADTIHVRASGGIPFDGSSWNFPLRSLQDALAAAQPGDQIRVAAGTYFPDVGNGQTNNDPTSSFALKDGVEILGGFPSGGGDLTQRDPAANPTILSGQLSASVNAYQVITASGVDNLAVLDGFTITGGRADTTFPTNSGGGMYATNSTPTIRHCTFTGNSSTNFGGAFFVTSGPTPRFEDCVFSDNDARVGGAVFIQTTGTPFLRCTFTGNETTSDGGAVYVQDSAATFTDCDFDQNISNRQGGAFFIEDSNPTFLRCGFDGNTAPFNGGAVFNSISSPTFTDCTFENNTAPGGDDGGGGVTGGNGGAVYSAGSSPTYAGCSFISNTARESGGACRSVTRDSIAPSPTFTGCNFTGNAAPSGGGAIDLFAVESSPATLTVTGGTFGSNSSSGFGGAINVTDTTLEISGTTFSQNTTTSDGGAVYAFRGALVEVTDATFENNSAEAGGALVVVQTEVLTMSGSQFTGNQATDSNSGGGAASISGVAEVSVERCDFRSNTSQFSAGALSLRATGVLAPQIIHCRFQGNSASAYGGACDFTVFGGIAPVLRGCLFTGNATDGRGSAARFSDGQPVIENCTVTGNSASDDGAFSLEFTSATFRNTIIHGNSGFLDLTDVPPASLRFSNSTASYSHCLIDNFSKATLDGGAPVNGNLEPDDPQFVSPIDPLTAPTLAGNAALGVGSPAIDAGDNASTSLTEDLEGRARVFNGTVDLGALESQGPDPFDLDLDLDGVDGGVELAIGSDPDVSDREDPRHLRAVAGTPGRVSFGYDAATASTIRLELRRSTDLVSFDVVVASSDIGFPAPGPGGLIEIDDPAQLPGPVFYRLEATRK